MENLKELLSERAEMLCIENNGFRFVLETNSFTSKQALKELELTKKELNKDNRIVEWCFDDEMLHLTLTKEAFEELGTDFGLDVHDFTTVTAK